MLELSQLLAVLKTLFTSKTYGETLESYIVSRNPQNTADIEKFAREFESRASTLRGSALW